MHLSMIEKVSKIVSRAHALTSVALFAMISLSACTNVVIRQLVSAKGAVLAGSLVGTKVSNC